MRRTELETNARRFWSEAFEKAKRPDATEAIEKLVHVTIGLAYAEKLLGQEYLPAATGTRR